MSAIPSDYRFSYNFVHSFGMTENYYVIVQQPMFFSLISFMANHILGKGFCNSLKWYDGIKVCMCHLILPTCLTYMEMEKVKIAITV